MYVNLLVLLLCLIMTSILPYNVDIFLLKKISYSYICRVQDAKFPTGQFDQCYSLAKVHLIPMQWIKFFPFLTEGNIQGKTNCICKLVRGGSSSSKENLTEKIRVNHQWDGVGDWWHGISWASCRQYSYWNCGCINYHKNLMQDIRK